MKFGLKFVKYIKMCFERGILEFNQDGCRFKERAGGQSIDIVHGFLLEEAGVYGDGLILDDLEEAVRYFVYIVYWLRGRGKAISSKRGSRSGLLDGNALDVCWLLYEMGEGRSLRTWWASVCSRLGLAFANCVSLIIEADEVVG